MSRTDDRRRAATRALALALDRPPQVQLAKGDLRQVTLADPKDLKPRRCWRRRDLLETLRRNGTITRAMLRDGRRFQAVFHAAQGDPRRAAPLVFLPGAPGPARLSGKAEDNRQLLQELARRMGGDQAVGFGALWYVLGCGYSIEDWAQRAGWNGRALHVHAAKGILIGALDQLARSGWAAPGRERA